LCSFSTAMICSSLYRLFFISVSFRRSPIQIEGVPVGNVMAVVILSWSAVTTRPAQV
jgi:hypothetical protein